MFFVTIIAITSCESDTNLNENTPTNNEKFDSPEEKIKVLSFQAGAYENYLKQTDNKIGFHSLKPSKDREHSTVKSVFLNNQSLVEINLNGEKLELESNSKMTEGTTENIYGKTIKFEFKNSKKVENSLREIYIFQKN